jgi:3'-phosphoadenosine 5'-phosphosulfate sulfotransferase (PAPS reductase)/FAD synthetase
MTQLEFNLEQPKHVIGLSGGKDSTALALRLAEIEPRDYEYICNYTGNELPELFDHLKRMEDVLGKPIKRVGYHTDLYGLIDEAKMLPNFRARFCTRVLKIEPTIEYFETLPSNSVLYVGLRADEPLRRGLYGEDINVRFPMREWGWGLDEVWKYLDQRGVSIPKRTDCAVCPYQRLGEWRDLWENYPEEYAKGVAVEEKYGHTFRSAQRDTWPASLKDLAKEFESGRPLRQMQKHETCRVCSL